MKSKILTKGNLRDVTMSVMDFFSDSTKTMSGPARSRLLYYGVNSKDMQLYYYVKTNDPDLDLEIEDFFHQYYEGDTEKVRHQMYLFWMLIEKKVAEIFLSKMAAPYSQDRIKIFEMAEKITDTREHAVEVVTAIVGYGKMLFEDVIFKGGFKKNSGPKEEFIGFFESREKVKFMGEVQTQQDRIKVLEYYDKFGGIDDQLNDLWDEVYLDVYRSQIYGNDFSSTVYNVVSKTCKVLGI